MEIPEHIRQGLMSSFHNYTIESARGFPIWDKKVNLWLTKTFGLQTDSPDYDINFSFIVFFDWRLQVWRVR